jgi:ribonuclease HI
VNNGKPNARAAWAFVSGETERAGLVIGKQTNNTAEAFAIYHALVWAGELGYKKIKLHTDSQISLHGVNKHHSKVKVNREIFEKIANVIEKNSLQIEYVKVLGHSGDPNNDRVDKLANELASTG